MDFSGVYTAIVTPFKSGKIDYESYEKLLEKQIQSGVKGIVPCGTTGESPTLSHQEHSEFISYTVSAVKGRVEIIAGTGSNSTQEAIELTRAAEKAGVNAVLLVNPYYNKPTQEGLYQHFSSIAASTSLDCVLYNIPGRTAVNCAPETIARLSDIKNINAIKEATGDVANVSLILHLCQNQMQVLSGDDALTLPMLSVGARGVISVIANVIPEKMVAMVANALAWDFKSASQQHQWMFPLMKALFLETNPIPVKAALAMQNLITNEIRLPLTPMSPSAQSQMRDVLLQMTLI